MTAPHAPQDKPLLGKRIVVTRARSQASELIKKIESLGGEAYEFPVIRIAWPDDLGPLDEALASLAQVDWILFTSVNGVELFFKRFRHNKVDPASFSGAKFAAVGPKTAQALERQGVKADVVAEEFVGEGLLDALGDRLQPGQRILLPRADLARKKVPEALRERGCVVSDVVAYQNQIVIENADQLAADLQAGRIHFVTFTASSTVTNFVKALSGWNIHALLQGVTLAAIGPVTKETATGLGLSVDVMPDTYTIQALIEAIVQFVQSREEGEQL